MYDPAVSVDHYPADRFEDDSRLGPVTGETLEHVIHNETYLLLKWLPWWRRLAALAYWSLVGTRFAPGLLVLAERLLRENGPQGCAAPLRRRPCAGARRAVRTFIERLSPVWQVTARVRDLR